MMKKQIKDVLSWQMAAVLIAGGFCFTAIALWAPSESRELLLGANGLIWTITTAFLNSRSAATLLLAGFVAASTSACGPNAVQQHTTAIRVAAITASAAGETISAVATADAERTCPDTPDDAVDAACIGQLRLRWAPADAAMLSVRLALLTWLEAVAIADSDDNLWPTVLNALRRVVREWNNLVRVTNDFGVSLTPLPSFIDHLLAEEAP